MIKKSLSVISLLIIIMLSACGSNATPSLSDADVASTAVAQAWTEVFMTQAALPTATASPVPPTLTPLPAFTPLPSFTPGGLSFGTPVVAGSPTTNPCDLPPPLEPKGATTDVTFINQSGGVVNLSFGLIEENSSEECGTYSLPPLGIFEQPSVKILTGCYWAYGWVTGTKPSTAQTINYLCMTDPNIDYEVTIGTEVIEFK